MAHFRAAAVAGVATTCKSYETLGHQQLASHETRQKSARHQEQVERLHAKHGTKLAARRKARGLSVDDLELASNSHRRRHHHATPNSGGGGGGGSADHVYSVKEHMLLEQHLEFRASHASLGLLEGVSKEGASFALTGGPFTKHQAAGRQQAAAAAGATSAEATAEAETGGEGGKGEGEGADDLLAISAFARREASAAAATAAMRRRWADERTFRSLGAGGEHARADGTAHYREPGGFFDQSGG